MSETIIVKISKELKGQLENEAKEKGLTLSSYVRLILIGRKK